jgi:hypothetical protein
MMRAAAFMHVMVDRHDPVGHDDERAHHAPRPRVRGCGSGT